MIDQFPLCAFAFGLVLAGASYTSAQQDEKTPTGEPREAKQPVVFTTRQDHQHMLDGALAWRQHDGGHADGPNIEHFIRWANTQWRAEPDRELSQSSPPARRSLKRAVDDRFLLEFA